MSTQIQKRCRFVVVSVLVVFAIFPGCGGSTSTSTAEKAVAEYYNEKHQLVKNVAFIGKPEFFDDSWRSPDDKGKSIRGKFRIEFSNGKVEKRPFKVFVAKSDGWIGVEPAWREMSLEPPEPPEPLAPPKRK